MEDIQCFMLKPSYQVQELLRRFAPDSRCERSGLSYHNREVVIVAARSGPLEPTRTSRQPPLDHEGWPTHCACGYAFADDDMWQHRIETVYRRTDTGDLVTLDAAPVGAMWFADWMGHKGPDGRCLVVKTPAGDWMVDGPDSGGGHWTRTGEPPKVTARPSIGLGRDGGGGWLFHAFLTDGVLKRCGDSKL